MGWDSVRHGSGTRELLASSSGPSAAGDGKMEGAHRKKSTVSHRAGTGSMATPAQPRSSAQPCAPPPRPPPPRPLLWLVLRLLLQTRGAPLLPCSTPRQHRPALHDRQLPPAPRAARHPAPTANRRPGPAPAAALGQWRVRSAVAGSDLVPAGI